MHDRGFGLIEPCHMFTTLSEDHGEHVYKSCMHAPDKFKPNQAKTTACTVFRQRHLAVKGLGLTKNETHMQHTGFHLVLVSSAIT